MSLGNDITLCPLCHGERGCKECPICEGEGLTFTWKVDEYNKEVAKEVEKKYVRKE